MARMATEFPQGTVFSPRGTGPVCRGGTLECRPLLDISCPCTHTKLGCFSSPECFHAAWPPPFAPPKGKGGHISRPGGFLQMWGPS
jgi:hypothetical protein